MRLVINGVDYSDSAFGLEDLTLDITFSSDLILEQKTTNTITAKGAFYEALKAYWFGDTNYCQLGKSPMRGQIIDDDCGITIDVEIKLGATSICFEECEAKVILVSIQPEDEAYKCLKNITNFTKAPGFNEWIYFRSLQIPYCFKLDVFSFLLFHFAVRPLIGAVFGILCPVIDLFGGDCRNEKERIERAAAKCDNYLTAAYLLDIFEFNCMSCGIKFSSTLLNKDPYNRTALLYQNGHDGPEIGECLDNTAQWRPNDQLNRNVIQIWDLLKPVFNSRVRMKNGMAEFERKDYFDKYTVILMDVEAEYNKSRMSCPEYVHDPSKIFAYGRFEYSSDPSDETGETIRDQYNDIVEWNPLGYDDARGEYTVTNSFGPLAMIGNDGSDWVFERQTYLEGCDIDNFIEIGPDVFYSPKLAIIDPSRFRCGDCSFNKVQKGPQRHNQWLMYRDHTADGDPKIDLYNQFHIIDSPEYGRELIQLKSFTWFPEDFIGSYKTILDNGLDIAIQTKYGTAKPERITINTQDNSITIYPYNIKCK